MSQHSSITLQSLANDLSEAFNKANRKVGRIAKLLDESKSEAECKRMREKIIEIVQELDLDIDEAINEPVDEPVNEPNATPTPNNVQTAAIPATATTTAPAYTVTYSVPDPAAAATTAIVISEEGVLENEVLELSDTDDDVHNAHEISNDIMVISSDKEVPKPKGHPKTSCYNCRRYGKKCGTLPRICQKINRTIPNLPVQKRAYDNSRRAAAARGKRK